MSVVFTGIFAAGPIEPKVAAMPEPLRPCRPQLPRRGRHPGAFVHRVRCRRVKRDGFGVGLVPMFLAGEDHRRRVSMAWRQLRSGPGCFRVGRPPRERKCIGETQWASARRARECWPLQQLHPIAACMVRLERRAQ